MPNDPDPRSPAPPWGREEPLFGPGSGHGEGSPGPDDVVDDALSGPLFRDAEAPATPPGTDASSDPVSAAWQPVAPRPIDDASARPFPQDAGAATSAGGPAHAGSDDPGHRGGFGDHVASDDGPAVRDDEAGDGVASSGDDVAFGDGDRGASGDDDGVASGDDERVFPRSERRPPKERSSSGSFLRELPVLLLIAFVLAFLLRTFVLQVFYIPSSSMEPTLMVNDRMAVEKVTYQFREPRRGEIVVFEGDSLGEPDPDANLGERVVRGVGQFLGVVPASARDYVKRVIGLPGDVIYIEDGQLYVNDVAIDEPYVVYPDGASYGPVTVPDDSLFFLGDNRPNSSDSRRGLGFVPMDDVVGRSVVIIWPPDHMGSLTGVEHDLPGDG